MRNIFYTSIFIISLFSCKEEKHAIEKIDFKSTYKFSSEIENFLAKDTTAWKYQLSAADYATKGDFKNALNQWDIAMNARDMNYSGKQIDSLNRTYKKVNAKNYILEKAKETRVVIINEAHHNSFHRVFTKSLLKELFDLGYTNLGLEALSTSDSLNRALNKRKYPILEDGHYTKEPQFGNLVREALEIGYHLFSYDTITRGDLSSREITEAKNIQKEIDSKPNEKFLIHCGFAHVHEGEDKSWTVTMAQRLKEYTGIDPLTISQTSYSEKGKPEFNHPLLKAFDINESTILLDQENNPFKHTQNGAYADLAVFHPNTEYINNRPNWLFENENNNVSIRLEEIEIEYPIMVFAFKKGEDIHSAVPVDIVELKNATENCHLGLKKGSYEIIVTNGSDSFRFDKKIE
jgi:hypothetical protein